MKTLHEYCKEKNACNEGLKFVEGMTIETFVKECNRGDWMLWLGKKINLDIRKFTLAKAHCANTVRHLMKDERSTNAVDVAIKFREGKATKEELEDASASAAADAADASAAYAAAAASAAAVYAVYADSSAYAYADAARKKTLKKCADICREHIGKLLIEKFNEIGETRKK